MSPWTAGDVYSTSDHQWPIPTPTLSEPRNDLTPRPGTSSMLFPHNPWNSQQAQISNYQVGINAGVGAFEPPRGATYDTHRAGEEYLESRQQFFGPEPIRSTWDTDSEGWVVASYPPSSYAASHNSPHSLGSPPSHTSSPAHNDIDHHSHIFTSDSRLPNAGPVRGRQRNLTPQEKKSAREVRDAKACWACHISKTKVGKFTG